MIKDEFALGFYCGLLGILFCYFLVYGPWVLTLGCALGEIYLANCADTVRREKNEI